MRARKRKYAYIYTYIVMHTYMLILTQTHMYPHTRVHKDTYVCADRVYTMRAYTHSHTCAHMHTRTFSQMHVSISNPFEDTCCVHTYVDTYSETLKRVYEKYV